jgi:hypothetical protein
MRPFLFLALSFMLSVQANAQTTMLKTLNPGNSTAIVFDVKAPVNGKFWDQSHIRVLLNVSLENGSEMLLKQLAEAGRYKIDGKVEGENYVVMFPYLTREVVIKGQKIVETVSVEVLMPGGLAVTNVEGKPIQLVNPKVEELKAQGMAMRGMPIFKPFEADVLFKAGLTEEINPEDVTIDGVKLSDLLKKK